MAIGFIYVVVYERQDYDETDYVEWVGTKKHGARSFLSSVLNDGETIGVYRVDRYMDGRPETCISYNPYSFMEIDPGEEV